LPFVFIGNVGEQGEGDLRGMPHIFSATRWKESIAHTLVLDGAGSDTVVAEALGSRRFEVIVRGPGGHSWSDFGAPNPIVVLARAIQEFTQTQVPATPKTTFNIGVIRGGTSVNSIPESASMRVDIRSTSTAEMERVERALRAALDHAIDEETRAAELRAEEPTLCKSGLTGADASWGLNEFCSPCSHWPEQVNEGKHRLSPGLRAPAVRDSHESDAKSADARGSGARPASPTQGGC